jgi:hypothetical protein
MRRSVSNRPARARESGSVTFTNQRSATCRGKEFQVRTTILNLLETLKVTSRKLGPYVLLEVLLPGGTLFALALFLYRRQGGGEMLSQALATAATLVARVRARLGTRATPNPPPSRSVVAS